MEVEVESEAADEQLPDTPMPDEDQVTPHPTGTNSESESSEPSSLDSEDQLVWMVAAARNVVGYMTPRPAPRLAGAMDVAGEMSSYLSCTGAEAAGGSELTPRTAARALGVGGQRNPYSEEVFTYLKELEVRHSLCDYIQQGKQGKQGIDTTSRATAVDWMAHQVWKHKLDPETLHLAVTFLDRFASRHVLRTKAAVELAATSCLLLADKFDMYGFGLDQQYRFDVIMSQIDRKYRREVVLETEATILHTLGFDLSAATPNAFLGHFLQMAAPLTPQVRGAAACVSSCAAGGCVCSELHAVRQVEALAHYLCDLSLGEYNIAVQFYPSEVAAAALRLSLHTQGQPSWSLALEQARTGG